MTALTGGDNGSTQSGAGEGNQGGSPGTSSSSQTSGGSGGGAGSTVGTETKSWRDSLPEDIRNNAAISSFQDVSSLTKSFIHAQSQIGKKGVIVPGEKATDEDWGNFYKSIGVPEAEKYEVSAPKDYNMPPEMMKQFKENAVKNGLLPKQAAGLLDWYAKLETASVAAKKESDAETTKQGLAKLKNEWGEAYDREIASAKLAVKEIGGDAFIQKLSQTGLGNDPDIIRFAAKAAKLLGEDRLREGGVGQDDASTKAEIQSQMQEIRAKGMENGYYDNKNPNHSVMVQKMESLGKRLTGGR